VPGAPFLIAAQTWIVACAKVVEIGLSGLVFQAAAPLEGLDGDVPMMDTTPKGIVHRLGVVQLAVAYAALLTAEAVVTTIGILDELLGRDKLNAAIHDVVGHYLFRVGMVAQELQLGCKRAEGCLHTTALLQPHRRHFLQQVEEILHLALAGVAVFVTELVNVINVILALYDGLGIEQGLTVLTFRGARLQFKEYSVSLTWHSRIFVQFILQRYEKASETPNIFGC